MALLEGTGTIAGTTEFRAADYLDQIVDGGFPGIRAAADALRRDLLDAYLVAIIDRDLQER